MRESRFQDALIFALTTLAAVVDILEGPLWSRLVACALVALLGIWALHLNRRFRVLRHINDVIPEYDSDTETFASIHSKYGYLGVSGATILKDFEAAALARQGHKSRVEARMLLIQPHSGFVLTNQKILNPDATAADADFLSAVIETNAHRFLNLRSPSVGVEVRFYQAALHHWTHLIDHREAIVGVRLIGSPGLKPTALRLRHGSKEENVILKLFQEEFETLWNAPETVDARQYFAPTQAPAKVAL